MTLIVDLDAPVVEANEVTSVVIDMVAPPPAPEVRSFYLLSDSGWVAAGQPYRCVDRYTRTLEYRGKPSDAAIQQVLRELAAGDLCRQQGCRLERVHVSPEGDCTLTVSTQIDSSD